jgi:hypothetical protein
VAESEQVAAEDLDRGVHVLVSVGEHVGPLIEVVEVVVFDRRGAEVGASVVVADRCLERGG